MTTRPKQLAGDHTVVVRRLLSASREQVYALWTTADRMPEWLLAGGSATLDVRVGGAYHLDMHYEGKAYPQHGEYLEVVPHERLVFTWISESTGWLPSIVTVELLDRGAQTELVLTHEGLPDEEAALSFEGGWVEILGWLHDLVTGPAGKAAL